MEERYFSGVWFSALLLWSLLRSLGWQWNLWVAFPNPVTKSQTAGTHTGAYKMHQWKLKLSTAMKITLLLPRHSTLVKKKLKGCFVFFYFFLTSPAKTVRKSQPVTPQTSPKEITEWEYSFTFLNMGSKTWRLMKQSTCNHANVTGIKNTTWVVCSIPKKTERETWAVFHEAWFST